MNYEDPGWGAAFRRSLPLVPVLPFLRSMLARRLGWTPNPLLELRVRLLAFANSLFLLLIVFASVLPWNGGHGTWFPLLVLVGGVACTAMVRWARNRPLVATSEEALAGSYRSFAFLGMGLSSSAALMGFVGAFITESLWVFVEGIVFALLGLRLIAPTRGDIERRQQQLSMQGSPLSLGQALIRPTQQVQRPDV